ncbi:MAG: lysylphosphatidylglycerol synthase domain-containing protein [Acidimicrobiales bacterium]
MPSTRLVPQEHRGRWVALIGLVTTAVAVAVIARGVDGRAVAEAFHAARDRPVPVAVAVAALASAFVVRAWAWRRVLPALSLGHSLAGIHLAYGANHVLPLRLGEPLRILSVVRRAGIGVGPATASTVTLRVADLVTLAALGAAAGGTVLWSLAGPWFAVSLTLAAAAGGAAWWWLRRAVKGGADVRLPTLSVLAATGSAWLLEAVLVMEGAHLVGLSIGYQQALLVTATTVCAQVAAVAPSGLGTFEAAGTATFVALGYGAAEGLAATVVVHAISTAYSLFAGGTAVFWPAPSLAGRLRLAPVDEPALSEEPGGGPVLLFLPAHDEAATVSEVVARVPTTVHGRAVDCLVIDDGSRDGTAALAKAAGAEVVRHERNLGLGATVRRGLAEGRRRGVAAVVFCDADDEYDPADLGAMVAPILAGEADYVVGDRFGHGHPDMRPHRWVGNRLLTHLTAFVARRPLADAQSGFRALSPAAAAEAEIVHDYNYAQVLTLDLLAKGYRYAEIPIAYRHRRRGRSFIKPVGYLRRVVPAVYRELNQA